MTQFEALLTDTDKTDPQNETPKPCSCSSSSRQQLDIVTLVSDTTVTLVGDLDSNTVSNCKEVKGTKLLSINFQLSVYNTWINRFPEFPRTNDITAMLPYLDYLKLIAYEADKRQHSKDFNEAIAYKFKNYDVYVSSNHYIDFSSSAIETIESLRLTLFSCQRWYEALFDKLRRVFQINRDPNCVDTIVELKNQFDYLKISEFRDIFYKAQPSEKCLPFTCLEGVLKRVTINHSLAEERFAMFKVLDVFEKWHSSRDEELTSKGYKAFLESPPR